MPSSHSSLRWTRSIALVILPFFIVNVLSVTLVTAASGDEYLTGSTEPMVEMAPPETWLDTGLADQTGSIVQIAIETGSTASGSISISGDQAGSLV